MKDLKVYKHGKLNVKFTTFKNELFADILEQDENLRVQKKNDYMDIAEFNDGKYTYIIASGYHPELGYDQFESVIVLFINGSDKKHDNLTVYTGFNNDMHAKEVKWIFKQMIKEINKEEEK